MNADEQTGQLTDPIAASPPSAGAIIQRALAAHAVRLTSHYEALALSADPVAVHQVRVAVRRVRSDLRTFDSLCAGKWQRILRRRLRVLADAVAAVRDRDVIVQRLERYATGYGDDDAYHTLRARLDAELGVRRESARAVAGRTAQRRLVSRVCAVAEHPHLRARAARPAAAILVPLAIRPWISFRRGLEAVVASTADADLHALRIKAKRARYAVSALVTAVPDAQALARSIAAVQDLLGEHQDAATVIAWLGDARSDRGDGASRDIGAVAETLRDTIIRAERLRQTEIRSEFWSLRDRVLDPHLRLWMLP